MKELTAIVVCASFFAILSLCLCFACWKLFTQRSARSTQQPTNSTQQSNNRRTSTCPGACRDPDVRVINIATGDGKISQFQEYDNKGIKMFIQLPSYVDPVARQAALQTENARHEVSSQSQHRVNESSEDEERSEGNLMEAERYASSMALINHPMSRRDYAVPTGIASQRRNSEDQPPKYSPPPGYEVNNCEDYSAGNVNCGASITCGETTNELTGVPNMLTPILSGARSLSTSGSAGSGNDENPSEERRRSHEDLEASYGARSGNNRRCTRCCDDCEPGRTRALSFGSSTASPNPSRTCSLQSIEEGSSKA